LHGHYADYCGLAGIETLVLEKSDPSFTHAPEARTEKKRELSDLAIFITKDHFQNFERSNSKSLIYVQRYDS
jgi:hypothetical protein